MPFVDVFSLNTTMCDSPPPGQSISAQSSVTARPSLVWVKRSSDSALPLPFASTAWWTEGLLVVVSSVSVCAERELAKKADPAAMPRHSLFAFMQTRGACSVNSMQALKPVLWNIETAPFSLLFIVPAVEPGMASNPMVLSASILGFPSPGWVLRRSPLQMWYVRL